MPAASKRSSAKTPPRRRTSGSRGGAIDRPFDPALLRRAGAIAVGYRIILEADPGVGYLGHALELPNVFADGPDPTACVAAIREALTATVATMLELGQRPPLPASEARRQAQVNIRLTDEERLRLEEAARRDGFRGLSDFVRTAALDRAG